jgi:SAM-dependent methyltransferase
MIQQPLQEVRVSSSHYTHGTGEAEQQRLTAMNRLINEACLSQAGLLEGERVIDFGAGLGQFARAMARMTGVPTVGIERSDEQIRGASHQAEVEHESDLLEMRQGDVETPPVREGEQFDVAHARFLLEHVRDPLKVVEAMVGAVRPGGRIILADDDYDLLRLWPEPAGFSHVWRAYQRTYDRHGNDPIVGRRLVQLLHQAGAQPRRNTWIFFGSCAGQENFGAYVRNLATIIEEAGKDIAEMGVSPAALRESLDALSSWEHRPDAAFWHALAWAEGVTRV